MPPSSHFPQLDLPDTKHLKSRKGRMRTWWENIPNHKQYIEAFAALLTIPVLLTVIILNINNLKSAENQKDHAPSPVVIKEVSQAPATPTTDPQTCRKEVGPVTISYPAENQRVSDDPLCIIIRHDNRYCSVVWSYRINEGQWSPYSSNSVCFNNLTPGSKKFELRVQSTVSDDQVQLERNFVYTRPNATSPTPATSSATLEENPSM